MSLKPGTMEMDLAILLLSVVGVLAAARLVLFLWKRVFLRLASRTRTKLDIIVFEATQKPVYLFVLFLGMYASVTRFAEAVGIRESIAYRFLDGVFYVLTVGTGSILVYAAVKAVLDWYLLEISGKTKTDLDDKFLPLVGRLVKFVVFFLAVTVILGYFEVEIGGLLATAGVASLAVALAAQETLSNMIAGFLIMVDRPFRPGDRIELEDGRIGDVFEVGLRSTKILSFENTLIVVPNADIAGAKIINHSYPDEKIKIRPKVGVAYGTDLDRAKEILLEICTSHPKVLDDPRPGVYFVGFGESSLDLMAICWVGDYRERFETLDQINMEIYRRFAENGIEIPFPQRDIHIRSAPKSGGGQSLA